MKYAEDTYLVIPACNVDSSDKEIASIYAWSRVNNRTLNVSKSVEIILFSGTTGSDVVLHHCMHGSARVTSLKIPGVTFTDTLSVSVHVDDVINSSVRSMYAIHVLQSHGMSVSALQQVFRAVVISKASPGLVGTSTDRQRIDAVLRRANKSVFWTSVVPSDFPTFEDLCSTAVDELLTKTSIIHTVHSRTTY